MPRVTVLAGGVGGARFLLGVRALLGPESGDAPVTVVGNVGDDITLYGLRVCPDLDSVMYTLGGGADEQQGWGRAGESFTAHDELAAYGAPGWFTLGDRDLATHLLRTERLAHGATLTQVTEELCSRWRPGVRLLPATDDVAETHVRLTDGRVLHFQEWWVRFHAEPRVAEFLFTGADRAAASPAVLAAIEEADLVLLAPSNPVVSIGAILAVAGVAHALRTARAPVIGISPIIAGSPVRGMADACLSAVGVATTAQAVAKHYGSRDAGGLLDGWLVDVADGTAAEVLTEEGLPARAVPLLMTDQEATAEMVRAALALAGW